MSFESFSSRIRFSPPSSDDYPAVAAMRAEATTRRYLRFFPEKMTVEDVQKRQEYRSANKGIQDYDMHQISDGKFVGSCTLFNINEEMKSCETGLIISSEYHSSGFGTEAMHAMLAMAFEEKKFHRVTFCTGMDNVPMRKWLENVAGATHESTFREAWLNIDGSYSDVAGYSILENEWVGGVREKLEKRITGQNRNQV